MNYLKTFLCYLSIFLVSYTSIQAQTTPQGQLNALKKQIEECKADIELVQSMLSSIEGIDNDLTIPARKAWTQRLNDRKACLAQAEKDLESLKVWYPSLFMPKSTTLKDNGKGDRGDHNDDALKRLAQEVQDLFDNVSDLLANLTKQIEDLLAD